jgi:hypothetical protein
MNSCIRKSSFRPAGVAAEVVRWLGAAWRQALEVGQTNVCSPPVAEVRRVFLARGQLALISAHPGESRDPVLASIAPVFQDMGFARRAGS